jgi:hypothetical protein
LKIIPICTTGSGKAVLRFDAEFQFAEMQNAEWQNV